MLNCSNLPLISIVVPIFNMEKYLKRCVESILKQSYSNIEVILVDDGSKDNSLNMCNMLSGIDERVVVISQKNSGVSAARNKGMEYAQGQWIMFVDPDDYLDENIVQYLYEECKEEIDIVCCCCTAVTSCEAIEDHFFSKDAVFGGNMSKKPLFLQLMDSTYAQKKSTFYTAIGVPWGKLYRSTFLKENKLIFDVGLPRMQDNLFNMYAFFYAKKVVYVNKPLYFYNIEHIKSVYKSYSKEYKDIFMAVLRARYKCLNILGLYSNDVMFEAYVNEVIRKVRSILFIGVFPKENKVSFKRKIQIAKEICNEAFLNDVLKTNCIKMIKSPRIKLSYWLLYHKCFKLYYLLRYVL